MRHTLIAALAVVSIATGQSLEKTLYLPDSFGGLPHPRCLAVNSAGNKVYVGGDGAQAVCVVSCTSRVKLGRVATGAEISCLRYSAGNGVLYGASRLRNIVVAIDGTADTVSATAPVGNGPAALCLDSLDRQLYCANAGSGSISVIGWDSTRVVRTIPTGGSPKTMICLSSVRKLYCADTSRAAVIVVDCAGDTVLRSITVGSRPSDMCYNPTSGKLYCACSGANQVMVIDCAADTVIGTIAVAQMPVALCFNQTDNKVYCASSIGNQVAVIDCSADSVRARVSVNGAGSLCHNPLNDAIYITGDSSIVAIHGRSDSVLASAGYYYPLGTVVTNPVRTIAYVVSSDQGVVAFGSRNYMVLVGSRPTIMCLSPNSRKLYCANACASPERNLPNVTAVDVVHDRTLHDLNLGWVAPVTFCHNSFNDKLYCGTGYASNIVPVLDCTADTLVAAVAVWYHLYGVCYSPTANKIYCASHANTGMKVIDGTTNNVVANGYTESYPGPMCHNWRDGKIYCANVNSSSVSIIDENTDSTLVHLSVGASPVDVCYASEEDKVFCANSGSRSVSIIDGVANVVLATVNVGSSVHAVAYSARSGKVYCTTDVLCVIDASTNSLRGTVRVGSEPQAVVCSRRLNRAYVANRNSATVSVIDTGTDSVLGTVAVGGEPYGLVYDSIRGRVYVSNLEGSSISVVAESLPLAQAETDPDLPSQDSRPQTVHVASTVYTSTTAGKLVDAAGRPVLDLHAGTNDLSRLSPGVYFVRDEWRGAGDVGRMRKVIIAR